MLKSLEVFGFKSFADRVRFDFAPGVTCVVGPNGSGKSNVVDALKWLLGDQSAKSLRGKEMTDVIFNGSAGRKPSSFAEATLTFDNSSRLLPLDMNEVQIGRRIWRNGDSEYLINRSAARLKDVRDLFLGTGAGSAAYSIIEQGRVDQILQANPTNRRAVFEEAAGISRYKSRKVDSQRKLERVGQNLLRLTDIVDEVEARLNSTRNQAAKAAKFREVSQDLQLWWQGLAADDYRRLNAEKKILDEQRRELDGWLNVLNDGQRELEEDSAAFDRETQELDQRVREAERASAAVREVIAGHATTLEHQTARWQELGGDLERLSQQQALVRQRLDNIQQEVAEKTEQVALLESTAAEFEARSSAQQMELEHAARALETAREEMELLQQRQIELTDAVAAANLAVQTAQARVAAAETSLARMQDQRQVLEANQAQLQAACDQQRAIVKQVQQRQQDAQQALRKVQAHRQSLVHAQDSAKSTLSENRERRSAAAARKSLLEDLELRQEGLGIGPKEILNRAQTSRLSPWDTVIGNVADLLDVDLERAALLEVALGERAQLIVLTEYASLLMYLEQGLCKLSGRVGFLAIPSPDWRADPSPYTQFHANLPILKDAVDLTGQPGVVYRADRLVLSERGPRGLAAAVLADTWVVNTLADAVRLAGTAGRGCRFITLQGEALEADGSLYVGMIRSETAIVSRKSELRRLKQELTELDRLVAEQEASLVDVSISIGSADSELTAVTEQHERASQHLNDATAELTARDLELARTDQERRHVAEQLNDLDREVYSAAETLKHSQRQASAAATELREFTRQRQATEEVVAEMERLARELEEQAARDRVDFTMHAERLATQSDQLTRLLAEQDQRQQQCDEADRRFHAATEKYSQLDSHIQNTTELLAEQQVLAEQRQQAVETLHQEKEQFRNRRGQLSAREAAARRERRELADEAHQVELRLRDIDQSLALLAERIEEEYQLKVADLAATDASAYRLYLEERGGKRSRSESSDDADTEHAVVAVSSSEPTFEEIRPELETRVNRLRRKLKLMGAVDTESLRDLETLEERFKNLSAQLQDLVEAKTTLEDIIRRINGESRRMFAETFETIRTNFQQLFRKVFGGGEGDIILEDPEDILECGIDIKARPPGKELRSISLLSGGEKTMTAIALIMAIFRTKPSPFCILDEVDAALDEANVERFTSVVTEFRQSTQFVMITHHKRSMTVGDVMYGVTMEESGVSKRMAVRFEDVSEDGHIRSPKSNAA